VSFQFHSGALILLATVAQLMATPLMAQTADTVYVATYLEVRAASTDACAALAAQYVHATHADAGNVAVDALQDIGRPNRFVIVETWRDPASFAEHDRMPHTLEFRAKLRLIHRSPYDQRVGHGFAVDPMPSVAGPKAVYVVTHVDVPGNFRAEAEKLLKPLSEASHMNPGHVRYDIYQQDEPHTNHFTIFAVWQDRRAFEGYGDSQQWREFREAPGTRFAVECRAHVVSQACGDNNDAAGRRAGFCR
jgi:quinol monooxygenase YgiN